MKRKYRIVKYKFLRWLNAIVYKKDGYIPLCAICNKKVEHINEYGMIGEYRWWGVRCHNRYGILYQPMYRIPNFRGKAFDEKNPRWELRFIDENNKFSMGVTKMTAHRDFYTKVKFLVENHEGVLTLSKIAFLIDLYGRKLDVNGDLYDQLKVSDELLRLIQSGEEKYGFKERHSIRK